MMAGGMMAFPAVFFLLALVLLASLAGGQTSVPSTTLDFGQVPMATYVTDTNYDAGAIGTLFLMVHKFLDLVQPNAFPHELLAKAMKQGFGVVNKDYHQIIYYELGFIVCAALGVVFLLLLPLVGCCLCMCRCCGNCGGEMHQRQRKNADCKRSCFGATLFLVTLVIAAGIVCAYVANHNVTNTIRQSETLLSSNFKDVRTLLNTTPGQIDYIVEKYNITKDRAVSDLDQVGPLLGQRIQSRLGTKVYPALQAALQMANVMSATRQALLDVNTSLSVLRDGTEKLQRNLTTVRNSLNATLNDPMCQRAQQCAAMSGQLVVLDIHADFSLLQDVSRELEQVNRLLDTNITAMVDKGYATFNDTPEIITQQTRNIAAGVKDLLDNVGASIKTTAKQLPIQLIVNNGTQYLEMGQALVHKHLPMVDQYDFYRWLVCIVLCSLAGLVVLFNLLGLMCGACGYDKHATPTTRGCISNTGGNFLMAGVAFSFIFSWLLMLVVTFTFVLGGNVEKLFCQALADKNLFKFFDTPNLFKPKHLLPGVLFNKPDLNMTIEGVYSDCKMNKGIYSAFQLSNLFNLDSLLNMTQYTNDITSKFDPINANLSDMKLLEPSVKQSLLDFATTGIDKIDFSAFTAELNKGITKVDLLLFADELSEKANNLSGALANALRGHAASIRWIHYNQVVLLNSSMKYTGARSTLNKSLNSLQRTSLALQSEITEVIDKLDTAQSLINNNASQVIIGETKTYMKTIIGYFESYVTWTKFSISNKVATCKPVSNLVDSVDIIACSYVMDSLNAFWFGLGWATVFLIPSIIFAVKLAKYYRRMDTEDVYDDMDFGSNGYQTRQSHGIDNPVAKSPYSGESWERCPRTLTPPRQAEWGEQP
ncbi:prominin-1 isoform X3 [Petromyzon marinus]|uniref:prominin-1 isoform X3 n=1 Tax=Petromyzon marinus TaxID=7757 RepID=UPI003F71D74B